jgi:hypothetical protein
MSDTVRAPLGPIWLVQDQLLQSAPGVGRVFSATLQAESDRGLLPVSFPCYSTPTSDSGRFVELVPPTQRRRINRSVAAQARPLGPTMRAHGNGVDLSGPARPRFSRADDSPRRRSPFVASITTHA